MQAYPLHFTSDWLNKTGQDHVFFSQSGNTARNFSNQTLLCFDSFFVVVKFQDSLERIGSSRLDTLLLSVIIASAVVVIGILALLLFCFWRKKNM